MVVLLGLAAAVLYGTGDFLGGLATRRAQVLVVLMLAETASVIVALPAAATSPGPARLAGLAWGLSAGLVGGLGLIIFYIGLAAGPMSVVAPVSGLISTVLPVAVALAEGERPGAVVYAGALLCLVAIVLASSATDSNPANRTSTAAPAGSPRPTRAIGYGIASGTAFGLFFLLIRNAGQSGELWPVAAGRIGELAAVVITAAALRRSLLPHGADGKLLLAAASAGAIDVVANICYVAATRTGTFGLAVVLASLYPGVTVLLAKMVLGERLRWVQRAGLGLAAITQAAGRGLTGWPLTRTLVMGLIMDLLVLALRVFLQPGHASRSERSVRARRSARSGARARHGAVAQTEPSHVIADLAAVTFGSEGRDHPRH